MKSSSAVNTGPTRGLPAQDQAAKPAAASKTSSRFAPALRSTASTPLVSDNGHVSGLPPPHQPPPNGRPHIHLQGALTGAEMTREEFEQAVERQYLFIIKTLIGRFRIDPDRAKAAVHEKVAEFLEKGTYKGYDETRAAFSTWFIDICQRASVDLVRKDVRVQTVHAEYRSQLENDGEVPPPHTGRLSGSGPPGDAPDEYERAEAPRPPKIHDEHEVWYRRRKEERETRLVTQGDIRRTLRGLSEKDRKLLFALYIGLTPWDEVSKFFKLTVRSLKHVVNRILSELRKQKWLEAYAEEAERNNLYWLRRRERLGELRAQKEYISWQDYHASDLRTLPHSTMTQEDIHFFYCRPWLRR